MTCFLKHVNVCPCLQISDDRAKIKRLSPKSRRTEPGSTVGPPHPKTIRRFKKRKKLRHDVGKDEKEYHRYGAVKTLF